MQSRFGLRVRVYGRCAHRQCLPPVLFFGAGWADYGFRQQVAVYHPTARTCEPVWPSGKALGW